MSRNTALDIVKRNLDCLDLEVAATFAMSDFELNINLRGCQFHYGKRLLSRVVNGGFKTDYSNKEYVDFSSFIRACIGLSYVPLDRIEREAFPILKRMAKKLNKTTKGIFIQLASNLLDSKIEIIRVISEETDSIVPINEGGGHTIYPPLYVLYYEESEFLNGHFQSIPPN